MFYNKSKREIPAKKPTMLVTRTNSIECADINKCVFKPLENTESYIEEAPMRLVNSTLQEATDIKVS